MYRSDFVFIGNYWNVRRDITSLDAEILAAEGYEGLLVGTGWKESPRTPASWRARAAAAVPYASVPRVLASAKVKKRSVPTVLSYLVGTMETLSL
jgi:hypothetical protein